MFFIEMGQGIIGRADMLVTTSAMFSCTFIAGHNAASGYAGAYHYPASALPRNNRDIIADMEVWASVLRPTQIVLIFAARDFMGQQGTGMDDANDLTDWAHRKCNVAPTILPRSNGAALEFLTDGTFAAGKPVDLASDFSGRGVDVSHRGAGRYLDYGGFTLIGKDREHI